MTQALALGDGGQQSVCAVNQDTASWEEPNSGFDDNPLKNYQRVPREPSSGDIPHL